MLFEGWKQSQQAGNRGVTAAQSAGLSLRAKLDVPSSADMSRAGFSAHALLLRRAGCFPSPAAGPTCRWGRAGRIVGYSRYRLAREKRTVGEWEPSPWEGSGGTVVVTRAGEK